MQKNPTLVLLPQLRLHKLCFLEKLDCQKLCWDQARLSSLENKQVEDKIDDEDWGAGKEEGRLDLEEDVVSISPPPPPDPLSPDEVLRPFIVSRQRVLDSEQHEIETQLKTHEEYVSFFFSGSLIFFTSFFISSCFYLSNCLPASVPITDSLLITVSFIFCLHFFLGCPVCCFFFFFSSVSVFVLVYLVFCFTFILWFEYDCIGH